MSILVSQCFGSYRICEIPNRQNKARKTLFINMSIIPFGKTLQKYNKYLEYANKCTKKRKKSIFFT